MVTKFIVVAPARSGSTWLNWLTTRHPLAIGGGEILHNKGNWRKKNVRDLVKPFDPRVISAEKYLDKTWWPTLLAKAEEMGKLAVGFKVLFCQTDFFNVWHWYEKHPDIKLMTIRRNPIARRVSTLQANDVGVWASTESPKRKAATIKLSPRGFEETHKQGELKHKRFMALPNPKLVVQYADLVRNFDAESTRIYDFLGLPPGEAQQTAKLQDWDIRKRVSNWAEFKRKIPDKYRFLIDGDDLI